jgi:hypothetical protein
VSLTGARVDATNTDLKRGQQIELSVHTGDEQHKLNAEVVRVRPGSSGNSVALRFLPGQRETLGALALYVLNGRVRPERTPRQRRRLPSREAAAA